MVVVPRGLFLVDVVVGPRGLFLVDGHAVVVVVAVVVKRVVDVAVQCDAAAAGGTVVAVGIVYTALDIALHVAAVVEDKPELYIGDAVHRLWKLAKVLEEIHWKFSSSFQIETGKTRMVKTVVMVAHW